MLKLKVAADCLSRLESGFDLLRYLMSRHEQQLQ